MAFTEPLDAHKLKFDSFPAETIKELVETGYLVEVQKDASKYYYEGGRYTLTVYDTKK